MRRSIEQSRLGQYHCNPLYMILRTYLTGETRFDYVVHAVAYYYDFSSPEAWRSAVESAVQLIAGASAQGA